MIHPLDTAGQGLQSRPAMIRLLNTDTFILLLRGTALVHPRAAREKNVAASAKRIRERCRNETREGRRVGLSAISLAELEYGLHAGVPPCA